MPPDVLLIALCFCSPRRWFSLAAWCTVASVAGGLLGYFIGWGLWRAVGLPIVRMYHGEAVVESVRVWYENYGFFGVLIAAVTPIPYKVFTIASGMMRFDRLAVRPGFGPGAGPCASFSWRGSSACSARASSLSWSAISSLPPRLSQPWPFSASPPSNICDRAVRSRGRPRQSSSSGQIFVMVRRLLPLHPVRGRRRIFREVRRGAVHVVKGPAVDVRLVEREAGRVGRVLQDVESGHPSSKVSELFPWRVTASRNCSMKSFLTAMSTMTTNIEGGTPCRVRGEISRTPTGAHAPCYLMCAAAGKEELWPSSLSGIRGATGGYPFSGFFKQFWIVN